MADKKKWIQGAIKHPGALREKAKRIGLISGGEALSQEDLNRLARSKNKTTQKQANLAKTLKGMHKKGGKK